MTEASVIEFQRAQVLRILRAGKWQEELHATLVDGWAHFQVDSSSEPGLVYTVRLDGRDEDSFIDVNGVEYNGVCDCEDFACRCAPNFIRNGRNIVDYINGDHESRTRCRHIGMAQREFIRRVVCRLAINQATS